MGHSVPRTRPPGVTLRHLPFAPGKPFGPVRTALLTAL